MIRILRIISILIAVAALGFIIFAVAGAASGGKIDELLSTPGVAEQLQTSYAGKKTSEPDRETPLIRQAKDFALRIDPPPPPTPVVPIQSPDEPPRPKVAVSAQFTLVGTSYYAGDDANSWALINEVGKGFHWVRLGETVGHLKIEKIGNGVVLIRDGSNTYELTAERTQKTDYVQSYTGTGLSDSASDVWQGSGKAIPETQTAVSNTENAQTPEPTVSMPTESDIKANIEWIKQLKENPESLGMTAEEAKELEGLGDMLKTLETELQQSDMNAVDKPEPNATVKNEPSKDANSTTNANENQRFNNNQRSERLRARRRR